MQQESKIRWDSPTTMEPTYNRSDIPQTTLFKVALELGAEHRKDLTVDTTHLIADEHGGAKYNVCGFIAGRRCC